MNLIRVIHCDTGSLLAKFMQRTFPFAAPRASGKSMARLLGLCENQRSNLSLEPTRLGKPPLAAQLQR